jgi:hypothetical protein
MSWYQTVYGPLICPVCGQRSNAEADLVAPLQLDDTPEFLHVGDRLSPYSVASYDGSMLQLRERKVSNRGTAIVMWTCYNCVADLWAIVGLAEVDGEARVISFEACAMAPETLEEADWIHPSIVSDLARGKPYARAMPREGRLSREQLQVLRRLVLEYLKNKALDR